MTIKELVKNAGENAEEHGFLRANPDPRHHLLGIYGEISEAVEELRKGRPADGGYISEEGKPEGVPIELADAVVRIATMCYAFGIDLEDAIRNKMEYDRRRPYLHGKRF